MTSTWDEMHAARVARRDAIREHVRGVAATRKVSKPTPSPASAPAPVPVPVPVMPSEPVAEEAVVEEAVEEAAPVKTAKKKASAPVEE